MATIGSGNPMLYVEISGSQVSGSGNSRTVRVSFNARVNGNTNSAYHSWYGYAANYRCYAQDKDGAWIYGAWKTLKGTETWYSSNGLRAFSQDIAVDVGTTSSKVINIGVQVDSISSTAWDGSSTTTMSVGSTNVAPTISGSVTANGTTGNAYIPENQSSIALSWTPASDGNGNLSGHRIRVAINGGGYTEIARVGAGEKSYSHSVSGYGAGTTFKYAVDAYDAAGAWTSGSALSGTLTKNTMTAATLASSSSVAYNSTSIAFTWSGAKNQVANTTFSYVLTCNEKTLSRGTSTGTSLSVAIANSAPSSGAYILKSDIINHVKGSSYTGTLNFVLTTTNAYGTKKTTTKAIGVNLQSKPGKPAPVINQTAETGENAHYNIWQKVANTTNSYMIPNGTRRIRISWGAITGAVGEGITYDMFYKLGSGGYTSLGNQSGTSYNLVLPTQTTSQQMVFMVKAKASYGTYSDEGPAAAVTLHYYNKPGITVGQIVRTDTTAEIPVIIKSISSIPNINTVGTYTNLTLGGDTPALSQTQMVQTLAFSGLKTDGVYTVRVVYNDNTGFTTANQTEDIQIAANAPVLFVNKYGVGVNGEKASANSALVVNGAIATNSLVDCASLLTTDATTYSMDVRHGLTVGDTLTMGTGSKLITSNNYGVLGKLANGTADYMLYMGSDDRIKLSYGGRAIDVSGNTVFKGGNTYLDNARYYYGRDTNGASRKLIGCSSSNNVVIGDDSNKHPSINLYGDNLKFNGTPVKINNYHPSTDKGISNSTTGYLVLGINSTSKKGQYLLNFEYNHHTAGSTAYWSTMTALIGVSSMWDGSRVVDRLTMITLGHSGSNNGGWNLIWEAPWSRDKALNSSSRCVLLFAKNADNTNINTIVRSINLIDLSLL